MDRREICKKTSGDTGGGTGGDTGGGTGGDTGGIGGNEDDCQPYVVVGLTGEGSTCATATRHGGGRGALESRES